jgi:hypothetical protein
MAVQYRSVIGVLTVAAAIVVVVRLSWSLPAQGGNSTGGGGDASRDLIAVTGTYGSGASVLYVIDTKTRHLAVYKTDNGRKLEFIAARDIRYDLALEDYNDISEPGYTPKELRRGYVEAGRTTPTSRPDRETPSPR